MSEVRSPGRRLTHIEVYPGISVFVTTVGPTRREFTGGWMIEESGGVVQVIPAEDLDDEATRHAPIHEFELPDKSDKSAVVKRNPVLAAVQFLASETMTAIARHELGSLEQDTLKLEGSLRIEADLIRKSDAPEELVAAFCDELTSSYQWIWQVVDELELPGLPDIDLEIEIPLGQADGDYTVASDRLKATADHFRAGILDVYKSVEPTVARNRFLPSLVAVPYTHVNTTRLFKDSFDSQLQTFEAVVRYLATVALIPVAGADRETRLQGLRKAHGKTPTLGRYVGIVRDNFESLRGFLPEVVAALQGSSGDWTPLGTFVFEKLTKMRNQDGPHGGNRLDAAYVNLSQDLAERLDEILAPLAKDGHHTLLVVHGGVDVPAKGSTNVYDLIEIRADTVYLPREKFSTDQRLEKGKVYLLHNPSRNFVDADPLVRYAMCPQCGNEEAFFLDHFDAKAPEWFSFRNGHRIS